jgi:hypothetical protein
MTADVPITVVSSRPAGRARDLARGWNVILFWGGPVAWMLVTDVAGQLLHLSFDLFGILLVAGTIWFGLLCLTNAWRCGRSHCWIDGILLPALTVVGVLNLLRAVTLTWLTYLDVFWAILIVSVVVECIIGSYPRSRPAQPSHP